MTVPSAQPAASSTEEQLLAIASRADRAAFTLLFARFAPRIKAIALRQGVGDAAAEEMVQEAMLNIWRKAGSFDPARGSAEGWIFTVARNAAIDARRRQRALPALAFDLEPDAEPGEDAKLEAAESAQRLRDAVRALPPEQIEVIRLSFFEDRPHPEIAQALGLPLGTVKSRIRLAMARLRALVEDLR